jgi:hypothetical protein
MDFFLVLRIVKSAVSLTGVFHAIHATYSHAAQKDVVHAFLEAWYH